MKEATKWLSGGFISACGFLFGGLDAMLEILLIFMAFDILSGWLKAAYQGSLSSKLAFKSLVIKKLGILISVCMATMIDTLLFDKMTSDLLTFSLPFEAPVRFLMILGFIGMEFVSINENLLTFMKLPGWYKRLFDQFNQNNNEEDE